MKKLLFSLFGILALASTVSAVQISVPSAINSGMALISTSTGAYVATTTYPFHVGSLYATSSTATSTFTGSVIVGGGSANPLVQIGSTTPTYGYLVNDRLNIIDSRNDYVAGNVYNLANGTCATADWTAANDLNSTALNFGDFGHTSSQFTGSGCANNPFTGFAKNSTYIFDPSGYMHFALGTTSVGAFNWFTGGYAASNEVMRLTNAGKLGIASTTPWARLSVQNQAGEPAFAIGSSTGTSFVVDSLGNVGVGTTNPLSELQLTNGDSINGAKNITQIALGFGQSGRTNQYSQFIRTIHNAGTAVSNAIQFYTSDGTQNGVYPTNAIFGATITNGSIGISTTSPSARLSVKGGGTTTGRAFALSDSTDAEKVTILDNGTVGIASSSPNATLTVGGQIITKAGSNSSPGYTFDNSFNTGFYSDTAGQIKFTTAGTFRGGIDGTCISRQANFGYCITYNTAGTAPVYSFNGDTTTGIAGSGTGIMTFWNVGKEEARFSSGFLGLGTSTPAWPLQVSTTTASATFKPQLALSDFSAGTDKKHWTLASEGGNLYIASSTDLYATTSNAALTLQGTGKPGILIASTSSSTPNAMLTVAPEAGNFNYAFWIGTTSEYFRVDNGGKIFAPNTASSGASQTGYWCYDANGQLIRDSAVCLVSALRFKMDIKPLDVGLADLMKLRPVSYYKKDPIDEKDSHLQMGFIADEVASSSSKLNEMLVTYTDGGTSGEVQGFRYDQFTALITKSVQDLNRKVDGISGAARSAEENWQWLAIGILLLWNLGLTFRKK